MDFSEDQMSRVHNRTLPQFSELRSVPNVSTSDGNVQPPNDENVQSQAVTFNPRNRCKNWTLRQIPDLTSFLQLDTWDLSLMQSLCEKQMMNVPNYSQNNPILGMQSNSLPTSIISSMYSPSTSQANATKQELDVQSREQINSNKESQVQLNQQSTSLMAEIFQKLQSTSLQQLIKLQTEQVKKQKIEEEKIEQIQNNILNIPSVRNIYQQNSSNYLNSDQMIEAINSSDLNKILQNEQQENESNLQTVLKVEQQVQTDLPKNEKKLRFRAKFGEIKMSVACDGTPLYYCPECNLPYPEKSDIEQHIQVHLQDRKYQCKECGAMLKRKEHLDQHMRGHSDERPFKCVICNKAFKRNEHLTRHCVIHTGTKDFNCTMCQKAFSRKDHLNKHIQTHLGIRKNKTKEDSYINHKDTTRLFDNNIDPTMMLKQETYILKDGCLLKHEPAFLQHLQKNPTLLHTFSSLKEQISRDANVPQQAQSDNTNGNARYLMPS